MILPTESILARALVVALSIASSPRLWADGGGSWQGEAPMMMARQETGAARIGERVYVVGGLLSGFSATAQVEAYSLTCGAWSSVAPLPVALDHMAVTSHRGTLYVIGGYSGDFTARDELHLYDPATDSWSEGAPLPSPRGACWATTFHDRIYVFGGAGPGHTATGSTFIYDIASDRWSQGADMPTAREHLNAVRLGAHIYVVGGRAGAASAANHRYDPVSDRWEILTPMPTARSAMAMAVFGGRIYAMGGEIPVLHAVNEIYDPLTNSWASGPGMPVPRHGVAAVAVDDRILLPGGGLVQGLLPTNVMDSFRPDPCPGAETDCFCEWGAPCGNEAPGAGCRNSSGQGGRLAAAGSVSTSADDLLLHGSSLPPHMAGIFFMGPVATRVAFGDGQRCIAAGDLGLFRFPVQSSDASGVLALGPGIVATSHASFPSAGRIAAGQVWNFQVWIRDPTGPCGQSFTTSNAIAVRFSP